MLFLLGGSKHGLCRYFKTTRHRTPNDGPLAFLSVVKCDNITAVENREIAASGP
jgi:hypothetical protein